MSVSASLIAQIVVQTLCSSGVLPVQSAPAPDAVDTSSCTEVWVRLRSVMVDVWPDLRFQCYGQDELSFDGVRDVILADPPAPSSSAARNQESALRRWFFTVLVPRAREWADQYVVDPLLVLDTHSRGSVLGHHKPDITVAFRGEYIHSARSTLFAADLQFPSPATVDQLRQAAEAEAEAGGHAVEAAGRGGRVRGSARARDGRGPAKRGGRRRRGGSAAQAHAGLLQVGRQAHSIASQPGTGILGLALPFTSNNLGQVASYCQRIMAEQPDRSYVTTFLTDCVSVVFIRLYKKTDVNVRQRVEYTRAMTLQAPAGQANRILPICCRRPVSTCTE
jgi:hypothetical protein